MRTPELIKELRQDGSLLSLNAAKRLLHLDLGPSAVKLVNQIRHTDKVTSAEISNCFDLSIQNASQQLTRLFDKGYLVREVVTQSSGGAEYQYSRAFE